MKKFKKLALFLNVVCKISYWIAIIGLPIIIIIPLIVNFFPSNLLSKLSDLGIVIGNIDLDIKSSSLSLENVKDLVNMYAGITILDFAAVIYMLKQVRNILTNVINDDPFNDNTSKSIINLGGAVIVFNTLSSFLNSFVQYLAIQLLDLEKIIVDSSIVTEMKVTLNVDANAVLIGLFIILLGGVFKYGTYLQKEYDATV